MKIIFSVIALTFIIITSILIGCSFDELVEVGEGDYIPINVETRGHDDSGVSLIESINVDRDRDTVEVRLRDGDIINVSFNARPEVEWPPGCPANVGSTKMEVLDLGVEELDISHIILKSPVLVRNCPQDPERVILREDGQIGGGGTACAGNNRCIHFKHGTPSEPLQRPHKLTDEEKDGVIQNKGFAIYLTKEDILPSQMEAFSHVDIAEKPIIAMDDIIVYNAQTHELKLTTSVFERISSLEVPVRGKTFMVCVDKKLIYWGAFWTPISSLSFDGVTIWKPLSSQEPKVITLELGYPSSSFYGGEDPRNNAEVTKSLEQAGKLINKLSVTAVDELPHSMKGYELYSWLEDDQWHFTLITGTNRNKTMEEVISKEDFISEAGWVKVHSVGVEAIKAAISKLPQNEFIIWLAGMRDQSEQTDIKIQLPPKQTTHAIKEYAGQCDLDF
jgi:hypothetical protein